MKKTVVLLKGDGIGPEIIAEAVKVLKAVEKKFNHAFTFIEKDFGGISTDKFGVPLTDEVLNACKKADAVLLGAVGGPKWDAAPSAVRPEKGLLKIRKELNLFANIRPVKLFPALKDACPLKDSVTEKGVDFIIVRELVSGAYFGKRYEETVRGERVAHDTITYAESEIDRVARVAFKLAHSRGKRVCSVDKANVLDSSKLWREVAERVAKDFPQVTLTHMLVDNAAMQLLKNPAQFDVIVTENMFGDILSDEASTLSGSLGLMPSASLREDNFGLYEPIHGSAPDIARQNTANPVGTVLSAAMMLRNSFGLAKEAESVEAAVECALNQGYRTADTATEGTKKTACSEMGTIIAQNV